MACLPYRTLAQRTCRRRAWWGLALIQKGERRFSFRSSALLHAQKRFRTVTPGQVYVLSGMVLAEPGAGGSAYLDLGDGSFEPGRGPSGVLAAMGVTQTQFIYAAFLVPADQTEVFVRVVRDGFAGLTVPGKSVWFDEIAVTPLSQFRPPTRA